MAVLTAAARAFVHDKAIGRVANDRVLLCDLLNPAELLERGRIPSSVLAQPNMKVGYDFLAQQRPKVVIILTMHRYGADFEDVVKVAGRFLERSPVSAVEASGVEPITLGTVARPAFFTDNLMLWEFQKTQFPWHDAHGKLMLPAEPFFTGKLGERYNELYATFKALKASSRGYSNRVHSPEERQQIMRLIYASISAYRARAIPGQFGWWLQHPTVQRLLQGAKPEIPLTMGLAHTYEEEVFRSFKVKPRVVNVLKHLDTKDARAILRASKDDAYPREVANGYVSLAELDALKFTLQD